MPSGSEPKDALIKLESRIRRLLPAEYQDRYEEVQPISMGSAELKYENDGTVAWDKVWGSFCDLAMAGGPPHKGALLEPGTPAQINEQPQRYNAVVDEICRGIRLVTGLDAMASPAPGWIRVECESPGLAGWLLRAIVMENVSARGEDTFLDLPAGPHYRIEKEIKNVITSIAKTHHYFAKHMWPGQQWDIAELLKEMEVESPLVQPGPLTRLHEFAARLADAIQQATGLRRSSHRYPGWLGLECSSLRDAIWMMRALVGSNVLSRREGTVLFVPLNQIIDPCGESTVQSVNEVYRLAAVRAELNEPRQLPHRA